jgi:hypothetical protein
MFPGILDKVYSTYIVTIYFTEKNLMKRAFLPPVGNIVSTDSYS